jgi:anaerobic sulfite reductase subunit C
VEWDKDALDAVSKAPALLRSMIKRKTESHAMAQGASSVTLQHVHEARGQSGPKPPVQTNSDDTVGAGDMGLSSEQIEKVIASTPHSGVVSESRFYDVKVCGGAYGCPRTLFDVNALAQKIIARLEASDLSEAILSRVAGPVLRHHKFSVALAGCPNSCSQPQINDFGVQGRARVEIGPGTCIDCRECVRVCGEGAMKVEDATPEIDRVKCVDCGDCAVVCPTEALIQEKKGYTILSGGKLGRHPQLARELFDFADEATLLMALDVMVEVFKNKILPGERIADAVTRIGPDTLIDRVRQSQG